MEPEEVPEALASEGRIGLMEYLASAPRNRFVTYEDQARAVLAAVMPEIERRAAEAERRRLWEKAEAGIPDTLEGDEGAREIARYEAFIEQRVRNQVANESVAKLEATMREWSASEPPGANPCDAAGEHNCHLVAGEASFNEAIRQAREIAR